MNNSTDDLLVILIFILTVTFTIALAAVALVALSIRKLLNKVHVAADLSINTLTILRNRAIRNMGIFSTVKYLIKARSK